MQFIVCWEFWCLHKRRVLKFLIFIDANYEINIRRDTPVQDTWFRYISILGINPKVFDENFCASGKWVKKRVKCKNSNKATDYKPCYLGCYLKIGNIQLNKSSLQGAAQLVKKRKRDNSYERQKQKYTEI